MKKSVVLNPASAYRKKGDVYAFYYNFDYIFFTGEAAKLVEKLLVAIQNKCGFESLPDSFLSYLISKKIVLEE